MKAADFRASILSLPAGWWQNPQVGTRLSSWFQHHLLGLQVVVRDHRDGKEKMELYTGFVIDYRGILHWVTAAHNLAEVESLLSSSNHSLLAARWCDNYPGPPESKAIPFDLKQLVHRSLPLECADLGFAWPRPLEVEALRANPSFAPLKAEIWQNLEDAMPEGYYVVGYPRSWRDERWAPTGSTGRVTFNAIPAALPITEAIEPCPEDEPIDFWKHDHCLYGRIATASAGVESIRGMSGGPVFSIERTTSGQLKYRLYGVQSSWLPESKIVRVEPVQYVVRTLDVIMNTFEAHMADRTPD